MVAEQQDSAPATAAFKDDAAEESPVLYPQRCVLAIALFGQTLSVFSFGNGGEVH